MLEIQTLRSKNFGLAIESLIGGAADVRAPIVCSPQGTKLMLV